MRKFIGIAIASVIAAGSLVGCGGSNYNNQGCVDRYTNQVVDRAYCPTNRTSYGQYGWMRFNNGVPRAGSYASGGVWKSPKTRAGTQVAKPTQPPKPNVKPAPVKPKVQAKPSKPKTNLSKPKSFSGGSRSSSRSGGRH
jgi:hypothetical protein